MARLRTERGFNPEKVQAAVSFRLRELLELAQSGDWDYVGRAIGYRDPVTGKMEGARRITGGWVKLAPDSPYGPTRTAEVIRKGKGTAFRRLRLAVLRSLAEEGALKRERAKRPSVEPHSPLLRRCVHCGVWHTRKQHKFHGHGAYRRTHYRFHDPLSFDVEGFERMKKKQNPSWGKASDLLPMLYGRVLRVEAQKTQAHRCDGECQAAEHRYYHDFKRVVKQYGLPRGTVLRLPSGEELRLPERSLLLTTQVFKGKYSSY